MKTEYQYSFGELEFKPHPSFSDEGAIQAFVKFDNGYEASVIRGGLGYGSKEGLYEVGVFGPHGSLCDPLGWGDDVKGWLTEGDVEKILDKLASL